MSKLDRKQRYSDGDEQPIKSDHVWGMTKTVYIRPVIGKNGEKLFVTHSADGVPISLDATYEAALARARMRDQAAQALH